ncbi:PGF-pre-PGF domain-containing protein [Candidatus Woesearchaeota archaeon]|nr:PGF-pre-PGF domain-containing protein [Candidatus Woesearchaeota archaeon]
MQTSSAGTLNWAGLDFSGLPYASNGDGKYDRFFSCSGGSSQFCAPTWDLRATWVTQDAHFIAWKITGKNFSNATFCNATGGSNLAFEIEFDADGNANTGCNGTREDPCYPGSDYHIVVNSTGNGSLQIYNSTSLSSACTFGSCFNVSSNVTVFVNISKTGGVCDSNPSTIRVAVNKSQLSWIVLTYNVVSKGTQGPVDLLGANRQEFDDVGFGGGNFFEKSGNSSFMFRQDGCGSFTSESYCTNGALNGNFSCIWESDFNHCRPNFEDTGSYGCSDFCGSCSTQGDCNSGARGTCKWIGTAGPCVEDFDKFRFGGNCDGNCKDCFNQNSCTNSRVSGGCDWLTDSMARASFCADRGTVMKSCGRDSESYSCSSCNASGCLGIVETSGVCAWNSNYNFCFSNFTNLTYTNANNGSLGVIPEICYDGADNNGNSLVDCADPSCSSDKFCGGGEFEKKMLTDRAFVELMRQFGICRDTSSGLSCNKEQAMLFDSAMGMDEKPGPPLRLKDDNNMDNEPAASHQWINILGFGFKDMGKSIGMGIMTGNGASSAVCGTQGNGTGLYYYYLDTDAITSTGCWDVIGGINVSGIEYRFVYNVSMFANGSAAVEKRSAYRCMVQNSTSFGMYPAKLSTPINPFQPNSAPLCMFGASVMVVPLVDIGNPSTSIVYHLATTDNLTNVNLANDTIYNVTYTPGAVDFIPPDCETNPMACGSAFSKIGGGKFTPFEDCGMHTPDEDQDGTSNCADTDCIQAPWCAYNRGTLLANDKSAPKILSNIIDEFDRFAMFRQSTSEPSNLSVDFYNTTSACVTSLANITDVLSGSVFEFDRYRPWHSVSFDSTTISDTSIVPLKANTTYYYRTRNCDVSGNCAVSSCLNFTTSGSGSSSFKFGMLFDAKGSPSMSGLNLTYYNGSHFVSLSSVSNISYISNTTLRFDNPNATDSNGTVKPWNIEFEGVDLAKATSINMTDMMQLTQINETKAGQPTQTRMMVGMNGTKWQEMAQLLGIDAVVVNISQFGNQIIKCDLNGSGCVDVTSNVTVLYQGTNYTTIRIPTYGLGGFSAYGVNNTGVYVKSDRSSYQCYPSCTVYFNVTSYQNNMSGIFDVIVSLNGTSSSLNNTNFNISYANLSNGLNWIPAPANNLTNLTNYNFSILNSGRLNYTVHQFKIEINLSSPAAERIYFNITLANNSPVASFVDLIWFDTINLSDGSNPQFTSQTPNISMILLSLNQTNQSCSLRINGTKTTNSTINATRTWFAVNGTLANGTYSYNFSCTNSNTGDVGNSTIGTLRINDLSAPLFNQTPAAASVTTSGGTITWHTNERTNTTLSHGTSSSSFSSNSTETGFITEHSVSLGSLSSSTTYYYNVTACDNVGNCNTTGPFSFTTSTDSGSSSSSSSGGGGGGGGTAAAAGEKVSRKWGNLPAGANVMNIVKSSIAIRKILLETTASADNVELSVTKINTTPSSGAAPGTTYQYLQIDASNIGSAGLKTATIEFNVEKKWLSSNNFAKDKVALFRYYSGKWNELTTLIVSEDTTNVNYKAVTPGFSIFAVSASAATKTVTEPGSNVSVQNQSQPITGDVVLPVNESSKPSNESGAPSLLPTLDKIKGVPLVNLVAFGIVGLSLIGVVVYFISKKK